MPHLRLHLASAVLLLALSLTGCAPRVIPAPRLQVPDALLTCSPQPAPPAAAVTDADFAD